MAEEIQENRVSGRSGQLHHFRIGRVLNIRLHDCFGNKMPNENYLLEYGEQRKEGQSDGEGFIRIAIRLEAERCRLNWDPVMGESGQIQSYNFQTNFFIDMLDSSSEDGIKRRLHNMGYSTERSYESNLLDFQAHYNLEISGTADEVTLNKLNDIYDNALDEVENESEDTSQGEISDDENRT